MRSSPHQRGLLLLLLGRVDVGAVVEQEFRGVDVGAARDDHERQSAVGCWRFGSAPAFSSFSIMSVLPFNAASDMRRRAELVLRIDVCARL